MKKIKVRISFRWLKLVCKLPMVKISIERPEKEDFTGEWRAQKKSPQEKPKFKL